MPHKANPESGLQVPSFRHAIHVKYYYIEIVELFNYIRTCNCKPDEQKPSLSGFLAVKMHKSILITFQLLSG